MLLRIRKSLLILILLWLMAAQMPLNRTIRDPKRFSSECSKGRGSKPTKHRDNASYQDQLFQQTALALGRSIEPMEMVDNKDHQARDHWNMLRLFPDNPIWEVREDELKDKYGPYSEYLWQTDNISRSLRYNYSDQPILPAGFRLAMRYLPPSQIDNSTSMGNTSYRYFLN